MGIQMNIVTRFVFLLSSAFFLFHSATAQGAEDQKFTTLEKTFKAQGKGEIQLSYQYYGEPVSEPARLKISAICQGKSSQWTEVDSISLCSIKDYRFEKDVKMLTVEFLFSRVDSGGKVHCDQTGEKQYKILQICRRLKSKK
jgi:hypothetical protein